MYSSGEISSRMKSAIIIVVFVSLFRWDSASAGLTMTLRNTEAKINDSTYLNCSTNLLSKEIHWNRGTDFVYAGGSFYEPYLGRFQIEINNFTGAYNLVIPSVQPGDAGEYSCQDDGGLGQQSSAHLTVLADEPNCFSNVNPNGLVGPNSCGIEPDELRLSCSVTYHGNIPPQMEWRKAGENASIENVTSVKSGNNVTYVLSLKTDLSMNNQTYVCQTTKSATYQYQCITEMIKVQYVFSNVYIVNTTVGEEVNCFANSSQPCSYKWKWLKGGDTTTESNNQTLKPSKIGSHRCEASCALGKTPCTIVVMQAEVYATEAATERNSGAKLVLLSLLVVLVIPIIVLLVHFILRQRRKNRMKRISESQDNIETKSPDCDQPIRPESNPLLRNVSEVSENPYKDNTESENPDSQFGESENIPLNERDAQNGAENPDGSKPQQENLDRYLSVPTIYRTITPEDSKNKGTGITGLTILDEELFVVSQYSSEITVYDLVEFGVRRKLEMENLTDIRDIVSCNRKKFLYILNGQGPQRPFEIVRMDPNGNVITRWSAKGNWGFLSVTNQSNVIFTSFWESKLLEFSPDGDSFDQMELFQADIRHPYCALKLIDGNFLVSHGYGEDPFHRVCVVDKGGVILKLFGDKIVSSISQMNRPVDVVVDEDGSVLVSDQLNKRVLLLDNNLQFRRELLTDEKHKIGNPWKILLDMSHGRLIVSENTWVPEKKEWRNGHLHIFDVK